MKKRLFAALLILTLAVSLLPGLIHADPVGEAQTDENAVFDPDAILAGEALAPVERSEWSDGPLSLIDPDEAQGIGLYAPEPTEGESVSSDGYLNDGGKIPMDAMVSFMDDDCRSQAYDVLYREVIEPLGIPYTLSVPLDKLGQTGYLSHGQLWEMTENGVSIACHTMNEDPMDRYTVRGLDAMLSRWHADAAELGLGEVLSYAYCNGVWEDALMPAVKNHFRMGFTVDRGINQMPYESFYMKRVGIFSNKITDLTLTKRPNTYLNANGTLISSSSGQRSTCKPIPVQEGQEYLLTCSAIWKGACYVIYDASGKVLEKYNVPDTAQGKLLVDHKLRIPAGAATLVVSHIGSVYPDSPMGIRKLPDESTLFAAKSYVDQVAREGGWLIFMTHAWYEWFSAEDLKELVSYVQESGIPIVDVNEAIRTTGNVMEVGVFRKPLEYASEPYFVIGADGRVYTNSIEIPDVPENHVNVTLELTTSQVLLRGKSVSTGSVTPEYVVSRSVDVTGCAGVIVTGWAYDYSGSGNSYQVYVIQDENGKVLSSYTAKNSYADGGDLLDHIYVALPDDAATILIAGNTYQARPELTLVYPSN